VQPRNEKFLHEIAHLKAEVKTLEQALAAAHGELHRLTRTGTSDTTHRE
jgi:hypothetical protein